LFIHLTLVPYIPAAGEMKTKPTQHSVKELRTIGIQPDLLICRSKQPLPGSARSKIALFTNVEERGVISLLDVESIYEVPLILRDQGVGELVIEKLGLQTKPANLCEWEWVVEKQRSLTGEVTIGIVGKYTELTDAYKSLSEALTHAGIHTGVQVNVHYIDASILERTGTVELQGYDAILVPGGFGKRGIEGKILAARYARENSVPYLGICLGMQVAIIEYARDCAQLPNANSTEFDSNTPYPVVALVTEWLTAAGEIERRHQQSDLGGTMRLGGQECQLLEGSLTREIYGKDAIVERHRHRYEVNQQFVARLEQAGLKVSGRSKDGLLVEIIELPNHPWFIGCQFHPEFTSTPRDGHPLFSGFIQAAKVFKQKKSENGTSCQEAVKL
jgi:CTP synthase